MAAHGLHRLLCRLPRRSGLGIHQRGISDHRPGQRSKSGKLIALDHECRDLSGVSDDGDVLRGLSIYIFRRAMMVIDFFPGVSFITRKPATSRWNRCSTALASNNSQPKFSRGASYEPSYNPFPDSNQFSQLVSPWRRSSSMAARSDSSANLYASIALPVRIQLARTRIVPCRCAGRYVYRPRCTDGPGTISHIWFTINDSESLTI